MKAEVYPAKVRLADGSIEPSLGFIWRLQQAFPSYSDEAVLSAARHYASLPETPLVLDLTPPEPTPAIWLTPKGRERVIAWLSATLARPDTAEEEADYIARDLFHGNIPWTDETGPTVSLFHWETKSGESEVFCLEEGDWTYA
jgi:hypothetical protein